MPGHTSLRALLPHKKKRCGIPECKLTQHRLLHDLIERENVANAHSHSSRNEAVEVALVKLRLDVVTSDGGLVSTNILVDEGGNHTLIRENLARRIGLEGPMYSQSEYSTGSQSGSSSDCSGHGGR